MKKINIENNDNEMTLISTTISAISAYLIAIFKASREFIE